MNTKNIDNVEVLNRIRLLAGLSEQDVYGGIRYKRILLTEKIPKPKIDCLNNMITDIEYFQHQLLRTSGIPMRYFH